MFPEIGKLCNKIFVVWIKNEVELMNILYYALSKVMHIHTDSRYVQFTEQRMSGMILRINTNT